MQMHWFKMRLIINIKATFIYYDVTLGIGTYKLLPIHLIFLSSLGGSEALDEVSVIEGDSVTLRADVRDDHDRNVWYYNEIRIAHNSGNLSKICTDDPCKVRFGDRLKLDHWTASLTIMNINKTDAGPYKLTKRNGDKLFSVVVCGESFKSGLCV